MKLIWLLSYFNFKSYNQKIIILFIKCHSIFLYIFACLSFSSISFFRTRATSVWPERASTLVFLLKPLSFNLRELLFLFWVLVCNSESPWTTSLPSQSTLKAQWSKDFQGMMKQFNTVFVYPGKQIWEEERGRALAIINKNIDLVGKKY